MFTKRVGSSVYFGIRHEGAAAFAASAYGRLTGRPAACWGIAGPGATNLLLWDADRELVHERIRLFPGPLALASAITPESHARSRLQVDFDPMMLGKFHAVDVLVWGEIGVTAALLKASSPVATTQPINAPRSPSAGESGGGRRVVEKPKLEGEGSKEFRVAEKADLESALEATLDDS